MFVDNVSDVPLGVRLLNKVPFLKNLSYNWKNYWYVVKFVKDNSLWWIKCSCSFYSHQFNVLLLTFLSYSSYHLARKPTSVVKNVLHRKNCSELPPPNFNLTADNADTWCDWGPFGKGHVEIYRVIPSQLCKNWPPIKFGFSFLILDWNDSF